MSRLVFLCTFGFFVMVGLSLVGCSGGGDTTVASADSQPAATPPAAAPTPPASEPDSGAASADPGPSYGAPSSGNSGGSNSGGDSSGYVDSSGGTPDYQDSSGSMGMGNYEDMGGTPTDMGMMGMGMGNSNYEDPGMNYDDSYGQMAGSMGMGGMGMGGMGDSNPYGGMGAANTEPSFEAVAQFVMQNCVQCHGPNNPKGDVTLSTLTDDYLAESDTWESVIEQIETGAMPPKSANRRPDSTQQSMVVSYIREQLAEAGGGEGGYLVRAKHYFGSGKEEQAMKYLLAHTVVADEAAASDLLSQSRWFSLGRRPTNTLRFVAGVVLEAPSTITDLKPVGTNQMGGGGGGGSDYGGGASAMTRGGPRPAGGETAERAFYDMTGDVGQAVAAAFESHWTSGKLGTVFNDVVAGESSAKTIASAGQGGGGYGGYSEMGGSTGMGMGMGMGMGADGGYGEGYGAMGAGGGMGGGEPAAPRKTIRPGQNITTGLRYIGTGSQKELLDRAAEAGADGIFIFEVTVTHNPRNGITTNDTRVRVMAGGGVIAASKPVKNTEVERARARGEDDEIDKNVERLFAQIDTKVTLAEMPPIKPADAINRVRSLINDKSTDPLVTMYETRLFNSMGLISQQEMSTIFQILMKGNEGIVLAEGTPQDRKLVMDELMANK
ncbi:MAG: c-type cytochrome domain-containing protein [Pirellulaceae bacterium]